MARTNVEGAQNVEVSRPIPCEKTPAEQLRIMERYTAVHRDATERGLSRLEREVACLEVIYPVLFRSIGDDDTIAGRLDFLPVGFGCVTSLGGVGHYCVFHKLRAFKDLLETPGERARVDALLDYWRDHDVKALYCDEVLDDACVGRFIDCSYPFMATARLSGMMLDYGKLLRLGVDGMAELVASGERGDFRDACGRALGLFGACIDRQVELVEEALGRCGSRERGRAAELRLMADDLRAVRHEPPRTFHQALQLFWLYALVSGCINYGRLDVLLGDYLEADIRAGRITEDDAYRWLRGLWTMIENRRTTVNGRIIVGGHGRPNPEAADRLCRIALRVCRDCRYVEPQFTLRFCRETPADIMEAAYTCIAEGATYPTLYNDDVEVPAVESAMAVPRAVAEQYVPFGCTEFVIQGKSVGTPNTLINLLKILQMSLHGGVDPQDGVQKAGPVAVRPLTELDTFEALWDNYTDLLDHYLDLAAHCQTASYDVMNREVGFLFASMLTDDCLGRGRALLDGGVEILGGTCETYGNINASDSLWALKTLVFDEGRYTLEEVVAACDADFTSADPVEAARLARIQADLKAADKYGNDLEGPDAMADRLYEYVARGVRDRGRAAGMGYLLIVISNNQTNTDWGLQTAASPDGRPAGLYMNPANNPQSGAARSGPTAMLKSLTRFDPALHAGSVQNIKLTPQAFSDHPGKVRALFDTYFGLGGCQLMVTVVDRGQLEDAQRHPELYPDLLVRVAGYSAVFVDLPREVQDEVMSRMLWD